MNTYAADEAADERDERALAPEEPMLDDAAETELDTLAETLDAWEAPEAATEALELACDSATELLEAADV